MTRATSKKPKRGESFRAKKARIARQEEKRRQIQAGKLLRPIVEEISAHAEAVRQCAQVKNPPS